MATRRRGRRARRGPCRHGGALTVHDRTVGFAGKTRRNCKNNEFLQHSVVRMIRALKWRVSENEFEKTRDDGQADKEDDKDGPEQDFHSRFPRVDSYLSMVSAGALAILLPASGKRHACEPMANRGCLPYWINSRDVNFGCLKRCLLSALQARASPCALDGCLSTALMSIRRYTNENPLLQGCRKSGFAHICPSRST